MKKKKITIGVIGYGSIAKLHISNIINNFPNYEIVVFRKKYNFDIEISHKKKITEDKIKNLFNYEINFLIIANPSSLHYDTLIKVYKTIKNIFIEKPLFDKPYNISQIINYKKNLKHKLQVGYLFRYDEMVVYFKDLIKKKQISKPKFVEIVCFSNVLNWRTRTNYMNNSTIKKKLGGGVLNELSHEIDYCLFIFGKPNKIYANIVNSQLIFSSDVEDMANILLFYSSGLKINIRLKINSIEEKRYCKVYYKNMSLKMNLLKRKILSQNLKSENLIKKFKSSLQDAYLKQLKYFFKNKGNNYLNLRDAIDVTKIINKIRISSKKNLAIKNDF